MRPADYAWTALAVGVVVYEAYAALSQAELLSEAVDRYRRHHPAITLGAITYLAAHLARAIPPRIDPLHRLATLR